MNKLAKALFIFRSEGFGALFTKVRSRFLEYMGRRRVYLAVSLEDVEEADWVERRRAPRQVKQRGKPKTIGWVVPPVGPGSGGHLNIFRFVRYLEEHGYDCRVYIYDPHRTQIPAQTAQVLRDHYTPMRATVLHDFSTVSECDALFATSWTTAYPVRNARFDGAKFYFVQDFEPWFYPVGTESVLAENTYRFGLYGITAGGWLSKKLEHDYGMQCDHFEFGSDFGRYTYVNSGHRKKIFFYARPVTTRRGFELGVLALDRFHRAKPEYEINMAGWPVQGWQLPFPFVDHGVLPLDRLNGLYNDCAAALMLSLTNFSLLPLELLAAGCIPVMNDGPNNRLVSDNPHLVFTRPTPRALADALCQVVDQPDLPDRALRASQSVERLDWDTSGAQLERIMLKAVGAEPPD
ncbi:MAG: glycosyltransferase family 4 protein [Chloroflexi bacterium]|nr:MAG: glycosyltransferase family 4 protein [Chloroflexota bacterium]